MAREYLAMKKKGGPDLQGQFHIKPEGMGQELWRKNRLQKGETVHRELVLDMKERLKNSGEMRTFNFAPVDKGVGMLGG